MLKTLALIFTGLAVATAADLPENEFLLDTSIVYGRGQVSQIGPAIASDGADYFIVWLDYRRDITSDIFGSRLTQTGVVLDSTGIAIRVAPGWQGSTDVAFGGASYLVVWGHQQGPNPNRIHGARVSLSGAVLDTAGFAITTAPGEQMSPAVAFSGTCYLVAWYDTIGQGDICARRVSTDGRIDSLVVNISRAPGRQSEATIAPTFDGWLVAWRDQRQTGTNYAYAARVDTTGRVLDTVGIRLSSRPTCQRALAVADADSCCLVVWQDSSGAGDWSICGTRVRQDGVLLDSTPITVTSSTRMVGSPAAAFDGTNFAVAWELYDASGSNPDIKAARISTAGVLLDSVPVTITASDGWQNHPDVARGPDGWLVAWDGGISAVRLSPEGTVIDSPPLLVAMAASQQRSPAAAWNGESYLVAWADAGAGPKASLRALRVDASGVPLDPLPVTIADSLTELYYTDVACAALDSNWLVAWTEYPNYSRDVRAARVAFDGTVLDPIGIPVAVGTWSAEEEEVAAGPAQWLVAWADARSGNADIYATRINDAGQALDSGIRVSTNTSNQLSPDVAFNGPCYLIAWTDERQGDRDIYGARVDAQGQVLDPDGLALVRGANDQSRPLVAADGVNWLVVYTAYESGNRLYAVRVGPDGHVLDPTPIRIPVAAGCYQENPAVAFDGRYYVVAWEDPLRNQYVYDIYAARIDTSGTVIDTFPIVTQDGYQYAPSLAHGSASDLLLTYSGWTDSYRDRSYRSNRIWGKLSPYVGTSDRPPDAARVPGHAPTIVHGVLFLPASHFTLHSSLFSLSGRKVMDLKPGANDVRSLAPGVYFVTVNGSRNTVHVRKVIVTR